MNERIKQLRAQATDDILGVKILDDEKFAELIVRECADVLDKQIAPPNHPMNSLGHKLKEHFGVK